MEIGQSGSHVVQHLPALVFGDGLPVSKVLEGRAILDVRHDQIGLLLKNVIVRRTQQIGMVHIEHHSKLLGENLDAILVKTAAGGVHFYRHLDTGFHVFCKPDFSKATTAQLSDEFISVGKYQPFL